MKLFIRGKGDFAAARKNTATLQKVQKFLDASKDGELFEQSQVAESLKFCVHTIGELKDKLADYNCKVGVKRYWGKPGTIRQLIKETRG